MLIAEDPATLPALPSDDALALELTTSEQLQAIGKRILLAYEHRKEEELLLVVPAFVARSLQAHAAVAVLVQLGFDGEAYGAMRTVTELSIDLGCIARDETGTKLEEFVAASHLKEKRSLDALSAAAKVHHDPQRSRQLRDMISEHPNFGKPPWDYSIEQRAKLSDRHAFVVTAYSLGSKAVHPSVGCLNHAYRFLPGDRLQWFPGPSRRDARAVYWANLMFGLTILDAAALLELEDVAQDAMVLTKVCASRDHVVSATID